jgi:hypothetical protein
MDTIIVIDPTSEKQTKFELTDEDFILTYVPEAADMNFDEALKLAHERSEIAAKEFEASVALASKIISEMASQTTV